MCKPSLHVDTATRLDLTLDMVSDADAVSALAGGAADSCAPDRTHLGNPVDAFGAAWGLTLCWYGYKSLTAVFEHYRAFTVSQFHSTDRAL